eukprot:GHRQ01016858.1.p1 GENE.GHRQ01016858.1~~GHRQ01016858.1.p1  ORF type:complete len:177 (-),score=48.63 GHRQ01016858.1:550-1080(-)
MPHTWLLIDVLGAGVAAAAAEHDEGPLLCVLQPTSPCTVLSALLLMLLCLQADATTTLKDLDLRHRFKLEAGLAAQLTAQLESDSGLLASEGCMDYSLLLGVHYVGLQQQQVIGQAADGNFNRHSPDAGAGTACSAAPHLLLLFPWSCQWSACGCLLCWCTVPRGWVCQLVVSIWC